MTLRYPHTRANNTQRQRQEYIITLRLMNACPSKRSEFNLTANLQRFFFDNCACSVFSLAAINSKCQKQLKTMAKVELLIELVKKLKILYDLADEDYFMWYLRICAENVFKGHKVY